MSCEEYDLRRYIAIILAGMPGSGKSLFSTVAKECCGIPVYVMGDIIREEVVKRGLEPTQEKNDHCCDPFKSYEKIHEISLERKK
jgi:adenylate kinase family enzyme